MPRNPTIHPTQRISPEFQDRLNSIIKDKECTKYEFSSLVGVSKEVISRSCLYGIIPSLQSLIKIADYLNISISYLLGKTSNSNFIKSECNVSFHERLRSLANEKHKKYSEIARKMIFPESYFHDWIRTNTLPSLDYLIKIAEYFNVSPDYILGRTDERD